MKKALCFSILLALFGCASTPEITIEIPLSLAGEFQKMSAGILESGGLSAVGIGQSKSREIAVNKAKNDGRIKLADRLQLNVEALQKEIHKETVQSIIANHIQGLAAKELDYETTNGIVTAYALMELGPDVLDKEGLR